MGMIRGALYEVVMSFLPDVDPRQPGNRARLLRATELLSILAPLMSLLDGQATWSPGKINVNAVRHLLTSLIPKEDASHLMLKFASPGDIARPPTAMGGYRPLFNRLLHGPVERLNASATTKLGGEAMRRLQEQLWLCLHGPLTTHLSNGYPNFFMREASDVGLDANVIQGCLTLVTTFITAVIVNDEAALAWLAPMIAQLPLCLPVGALADDPNRWVILK